MYAALFLLGAVNVAVLSINAARVRSSREHPVSAVSRRALREFPAPDLLVVFECLGSSEDHEDCVTRERCGPEAGDLHIVSVRASALAACADLPTPTAQADCADALRHNPSVDAEVGQFEVEWLASWPYVGPLKSGTGLSAYRLRFSEGFVPVGIEPRWLMPNGVLQDELPTNYCTFGAQWSFYMIDPAADTSLPSMSLWQDVYLSERSAGSASMRHPAGRGVNDSWVFPAVQAFARVEAEDRSAVGGGVTYSYSLPRAGRSNELGDQSNFVEFSIPARPVAQLSRYSYQYDVLDLVASSFSFLSLCSLLFGFVFPLLPLSGQVRRLRACRSRQPAAAAAVGGELGYERL